MEPLICITGADGTGKSSLVDELCKINSSYVPCAIWDLLADASELPFKSKQDIDNYLCRLTPDSRTLFLAHAFKYAIDKAIKSTNAVMINSYYYKYFASELALGASPSLINNLIPLFPVPDIVIYLETPVVEASNRKQGFSRYECGLIETPDAKSFISFQKKTIQYWDIFKNNNWYVIDTIIDENEKVIKAKNLLGWK